MKVFVAVSVLFLIATFSLIKVLPKFIGSGATDTAPKDLSEVADVIGEFFNFSIDGDTEQLTAVLTKVPSDY